MNPENTLAIFYQIATQRLNKLGITQILRVGSIAHSNEKESFLSYRRDGKQEEWRV